MNETYSPEQRYFIKVLAAVIRGEDAPPVPEPFAWEVFYDLCWRHNLSGMVGFGLKKTSVTMPQGVQELFERDGQSGIFHEAKRTYEVERLFSLFDKAKIAYVPMKGAVIRKLYPSPDFRTMGDIDLLVTKKDLKKIQIILIDEGYTVVRHGERNSEFFKPPFLRLEIHHTCFHPVERVFENGLPEYYRIEQVWNRMTHQDNGYRFEPNRVDFFLMFFLHLTRHFQDHGIGVRYILDFTVLKRQLSYTLNEQEIALHLNELGLMEFASHIDHLADVWFEGADSDQVTDRLGYFILTNSVHGENFESVAMKLAEVSAVSEGKLTKSKWMMIYIYFFPSRARMKENYPCLAFFPFFLPACYLHWNLRRLIMFRHWSHYFRLLRSVFRISSTEVAERTSFYKELGLNAFPNKK